MIIFPNGDSRKMNMGEAYGDLYSTFGVDLSTEPGRVLNSPNCLNLIDQSDVANFDTSAGAFVFDSSRYYAIGDVVTRSGANTLENPTSGWALDSSTSTPSLDTANVAAAVFNSELLVSGKSSSNDIFRLVGTTWSSWWQGTLAQSALSTARCPMGVGPTGRLYILDGSASKVYNVTTAGTVTKTGNGTLDLSDRGIFMYTLRFSSNRAWLTGHDITDGKGVVVEWDMSLNESTPTRIHKIDSHTALSLVILEDRPLVMGSDGILWFYDGASFFTKEGARLPEPPTGYRYRGDRSLSGYSQYDSFIMHFDGAAVIDGLAHFLIRPVLRNPTGTTIAPAGWSVLSGVYCYDPRVGLYNRFPIERDGGTSGFGASQSTATMSVGALLATNAADAKFLGSAMFSINGATRAVVFSDNNERTLASRGIFVLNPLSVSPRNSWQKIEALCTRFKNSSDRILLKYRLAKKLGFPQVMSVTWVSTTSFTTTDTDFSNVAVGDWILVQSGNGSGCTAHVSAVSYSNPTYTVTIDEAVTGVSASDTGDIVVDNWKRLATFSNQKTDYHDASITDTAATHKLWLMVELRAAASSVVELDKLFITPNN